MARNRYIQNERYAEIIRAGGTPKQARAARNYGDERYAQTLKGIQRNNTRRQNRATLRAAGFSPQEADRLKGSSSVRIQGAIRERRERAQRLANASRTIARRALRRGDWKEWSERGGNGFPSSIERLAADINSRSGKDDFDSYGYRALYHYYVDRGLDIETMDIDDIDLDAIADFDGEYMRRVANA